ncbi:DNA-binding transcriptional regulator BolA [Coccinella septempunctata]|uniref:DNA-binding transcriptional regulator BolA n=1 Tax=Coccinella septempunctata TaxID=41139 RepID=UPI001D07C3FB|nr:DNA-binding transcriptional regulator BolA [Coccinella septempunctata]
MLTKFFQRSILKSSLKNMSHQKSVENTIHGKLTENLNPSYLKIMNESYMHNVKPGSETHFKVIVISEQFNQIPNIKRHQIIYKLLSEEMKNGVHALSVVAKTPEEWDASDKNLEPSPNCRGGFGQ